MTYSPIQTGSEPATRHELVIAGNLRDFTLLSEEPPRCIIVVGGGACELADANGDILTYVLGAGLQPFRPTIIGAGTAVDIVCWW